MEECSTLFNRKFLCTVVENDRMCKKEHSYVSELVLHSLMVHGKYLCDQCGFKFDSHAELLEHDHTHVETLKCESIILA